MSSLVDRHAASWVPRRTLTQRLSAPEAGRVTVLCAPAGSGKTVLLRSWLQAAWPPDRSAWVSVERDERDGQRFWLAVVAALAAVDEVVARVEPAPTFSDDAVVDRLLAAVAALTHPAVLVVDDLHELRSPSALQGLERFLTHAPDRLRVVLSTREDPRLGLHRLLLTGEMGELREADLRFSPAEARELLQASGITLSDAGVAVLHERTEGWAAGLRLAAISLAGHPEPERFVREFSGSERTVAGYLLAEVLDHRPPEVRDLLLRTSVLERVSGPLADRLSGGLGAERILQELEDAGAFVTALDAGRTWFRYHHLFADLLRLELRRLSPSAVGPLHRAAALWWEEGGEPLEAVRHAQAAGDWALASRLLADHHIDLTLDGRAAAIRPLLRAFPDEAVAADGELALVLSVARLLDGELAASAADLSRADALAGAVADERRARFDATRAMLHVVVGRWRGALDEALAGMRALEAVRGADPVADAEDGDELQAIALQNLGVAQLWSSQVQEAGRNLTRAFELAGRAGRPWLQISPLGHLAVAATWTGLPLGAALERAERALAIADTNGWGADPITLTARAGAPSSCCGWRGSTRPTRGSRRPSRSCSPAASRAAS